MGANFDDDLSGDQDEQVKDIVETGTEMAGATAGADVGLEGVMNLLWSDLTSHTWGNISPAPPRPHCSSCFNNPATDSSSTPCTARSKGC
jgi:hypothetical protein